ncbi:nuclear transcription factor Y subunit B-7 [Humulus lupulus]|uniref:nuclear transcription factor Y subunit B-7 n=1 Tax=Humulus lupulus TaxID=3486 RepID=UPI002B414675|nr:nuclear transcription factor Y subunit B-7 [Humulus lupulus]XP_062096098.1 nuclear transcription factor Y subunit B-7 [Humulus lupulus]
MDDDHHLHHQYHQSYSDGPSGLDGGSPESPLCLKNNPTTNSKIQQQHHSLNTNKEQDRFLPIANVGRIMKKMIPGNGKISKDAKETVQECVSEFISFVTGEASDKCQREKRKTINGDDIIWAITTLGFENYVSPLKIYLEKYREIEGEKLNIPKQQRSNDQQRQLIQQQQQQQLLLDHQQDQQSSTHLLPNFNSLYSSTNLIPHPPFVATDHQPFPGLPVFSPSSIPKLHPQDVDS